MAKKFVVLFNPGEQPKVLVNADPAQYDPRYMLVNPVLPSGIPPHRWAKVGNTLQVLPESEVLQKQPPMTLAPAKPQPLSKRQYIAMALVSLILATILHIITKG